MADDQDQSQKTEEPTHKRLEDARRKGQVASSREVGHVFVLGAATLLIGGLGPDLAVRLGNVLLPFLAAPHSIEVDPGGLGDTLTRTALAVGAVLLLPTLLFVAAALAAGLVQNGLVVSGQPLQPKLERLSLVAGVKRLASLRQAVEFLKGVLKIVLVTVTAGFVLWPWVDPMMLSVALDAGPLAGLLGDVALRLLGAITALVGLLALLDVAYQRFEHKKQLRMSRQDLKDEFKQTEGDPQLKARLRGLRMERARRRMMAAVPDATVVITNPTHVAVALRYDSDRMSAPQVVAKGADRVALKIREVARDAGVPLIENPPLARTLHAVVEIGAEVPPVHYQAVAEIIGRVMHLRPRR